LRSIDTIAASSRDTTSRQATTPRDRWLGELRFSEIAADRVRAYLSASPFPHIVLDGLLPDAVLKSVLAEFPGPNDIEWIRFRRGHERKLASMGDRDFGSHTRDLLSELNSSTFVTFLEDLTGIRGLIPDPHFDGGGLHQIERGGHLDIHVDFNRHPRLRLDRRLNLIVYLNEDWREHWGGHIEFWNRDVSNCDRKILPIFNRTVIFSTTETSWHGHPDPLVCPPDRTRKSLALYYYTSGRPRDETALSHSTAFRLRPTQAIRLAHDVVLTKLLPPIVLDAARALRKRFRR
jgi:2OG-Fe(II) oxygenase superfamily